MSDRITTKEAAEKLGCSEQAVRVLMQRGLLPIGVINRNGRRRTYYIIRSKLDNFLENT